MCVGANEDKRYGTCAGDGASDPYSVMDKQSRSSQRGSSSDGTVHGTEEENPI